ncbi:MAG: hypothetical protein IPJ59_09275 [Nannocystis sp.]|nr:hypothetical protein [Nannocystis sp.]
MMRRRDVVIALGTALLGSSISCCVCADTPICTPHGLRRLGDLQVGDQVLGYDVISGEVLVRTIVARRSAHRECLRLVHSTGELVCTPDHPLYSPETGAYEPAARWAEGTRKLLLVADAESGHSAQLLDAAAFAGLREVVDITVDESPHNFIAGGVVVHNKSFAYQQCEGEVEGPSFELTLDAPLRRFEIRACIAGREPSSDEYGSAMGISISSAANGASGAGEMRYAVYLEGEGDPEVVDQRAGEELHVGIDNLGGMCSTPRAIVFERLDGLTQGTIVISWNIAAGSDPPQGTTIDDPIDIEIRE